MIKKLYISVAGKRFFLQRLKYGHSAKVVEPPQIKIRNEGIQLRDMRILVVLRQCKPSVVQLRYIAFSIQCQGNSHQSTTPATPNPSIISSPPMIMIPLVFTSIVPMPTFGRYSKVVCGIFLQTPSILAHVPFRMSKRTI